MSKKLYEESNIQSIAEAIREKNGTQNTYTPAQMGNAVRAIPNTYAAADEGKVVSGGALKTQTETTVTENGSVDTTEIRRLNVAVSSGGGTGILISKNIDHNGTYAALDDSADGYDVVTVQVDGGSGDGAIVRPKYQGLSYAYVISNGTEIYLDANKNQYLNIFEVEKNHAYCLCLGQKVGARRRASFFENMTFEELAPYLDSQPQSTGMIYDNGKCLAPFQSGRDDSGDALTGRIIFRSTGGLVVYGTDNAGQEVPAMCFDLGSLTEKQIEYIEASSNNAQYFDIGIRMTDTTFYEVDLRQVSAPVGENYFLGAFSVEYNEISANNSAYTVYVGGSGYGLQHSNDRHKIKVYDGKLFFDDAQVNNVSMRSSNSNMFLFSRSNSNNQPSGYGSNIRIYGLKIWDGESLIHDFHPVKFYAEIYSVCALYDSVTETYVYPLGVDAGLLAGPVLN